MNRNRPHRVDNLLAGIGDVALLSAAEEKDLAEAIARGDRHAKDRLIRANLRLVVKIARDYTGRGLEMDDLIGEGNLGLIRAAEEYDPAFGTRFSTYAAYWIKQAIRHALINTTATVRLPAHMIGLLTKCRRAGRRLHRERGHAPSPEEVADLLGLSDRRRSMVEDARRAGGLRLECAFAEEGSPLGSSESTEPRNSAAAAAIAGEELAGLRRNLDRLDGRERAILARRFGLGGETPLTLKEVGRRLGVTREWVRKIELRALKKLAEELAPAEPGGDGVCGRRAPSRSRAAAHAAGRQGCQAIGAGGARA